jgi:hypothetical protein
MRRQNPICLTTFENVCSDELILEKITKIEELQQNKKNKKI